MPKVLCQTRVERLCVSNFDKLISPSLFVKLMHYLSILQADDKSLLARFYHADRSLTAVASELDSFDGRAEPDRCTRLVSRLRQNQVKTDKISLTPP